MTCGSIRNKKGACKRLICKEILVGLSRFELLTSAMSRQRSNQLSYSPEVPRILLMF